MSMHIACSGYTGEQRILANKLHTIETNISDSKEKSTSNYKFHKNKEPVS